MAVEGFISLWVELRAIGNEKEMGLIISAITFKVDLKGGNAYIFWLGTREDIPKDYQDDFSNHFNGSYRKLGLSSFLMAVVIKFLAASDVTEIKLFLQYLINTPNVMLYYSKREFTSRKI